MAYGASKCALETNEGPVAKQMPVPVESLSYSGWGGVGGGAIYLAAANRKNKEEERIGGDEYARG